MDNSKPIRSQPLNKHSSSNRTMVDIYIKKRWRTNKDIALDLITYLMAITLFISSLLTVLDWFYKTLTNSFLLSYTVYTTWSIYFMIMFIISDIVFVFLFDDTADHTLSSIQSSEPALRSKLSSVESMQYSISHPLQTIQSMSKEELCLLAMILLSYIMQCTQYNPQTTVWRILHDIGYTMVRFLTFLHINDYFGIRPYILSLSFLLFLFRDIIKVLYITTIQPDLAPVNQHSLLVIMVNFSTNFYIFHKILARLIYPNVNVYQNAKLDFKPYHQYTAHVYSNGLGGVRDTPIIECCFQSQYTNVLTAINLMISVTNALLSMSLIYFTFDHKHRKSFYYYSMLNCYCTLFTVQSFLLTFIRSGQNKTFSAFKIWNILFYVSVFRFFSLSRDVWYIWVNVLNTLLFINLVFFIGEFNHYKKDWSSGLRMFGWFIMCGRYYYEGFCGLQDTLYGSEAHGWTVLLWNVGLFFEQNTYFTVMKLIIFKCINWKLDPFRFKDIIQYQEEKIHQTGNYGIKVDVVWEKSEIQPKNCIPMHETDGSQVNSQSMDQSTRSSSGQIN